MLFFFNCCVKFKDRFCQFSYINFFFLLVFSQPAWVQVSEGRETVSVVFKINREVIRGGHVIAEKGCWNLLKGGILANFSASAEFLFEVNMHSSTFANPLLINTVLSSYRLFD